MSNEKEINTLSKVVQNLIQSNNNQDDEHYQAASDYFTDYISAKTNRKLNTELADE